MSLLEVEIAWLGLGGLGVLYSATLLVFGCYLILLAGLCHVNEKTTLIHHSNDVKSINGIPQSCMKKKPKVLRNEVVCYPTFALKYYYPLSWVKKELLKKLQYWTQ